jgi:hypothetical protein
VIFYFQFVGLFVRSKWRSVLLWLADHFDDWSIRLFRQVRRGRHADSIKRACLDPAGTTSARWQLDEGD